MAESSEGLLPHPEPEARSSIPNKIEIVPEALQGDQIAAELPSFSPEQPTREASESFGHQKEEEPVSEVGSKSQQTSQQVTSSGRIPVSEKAPSFTKKVGNFFADTRLRAMAGTVTKSWGLVLGADIAATVLGHPGWLLYAATPILTYTVYEAYKAVLGGGIKLGQYTSLFKEYSTNPKVTPAGTVRSGELVGSVHLVNSLGKMSDLSARERALAVPLDGLRGLDKLREKFEENSKDVRGIVAIKASSHLVAQNRELFENLGFALQEQSRNEKNGMGNKITGKMIILPVWGIRQLFRERSLRGFREANRVRLGESQTAWITPQALCSPRSRDALHRNIQRIEPMLEKLHKRSAGV